MSKGSEEKTILESLTKAAAALGDPGRFRLFCYIAQEERCVCDLVDLIELAPATVSRHLTLMREARLIKRLKVGRFHHYRLAKTGPAVELARYAAGLAQDDPVVAKDARRVPKRLELPETDGACCTKKA